MNIQFACTYWGQEGTAASTFLQKILNAGYRGAEVFLGADIDFKNAIIQEVEKARKNEHDFVFIPLQLLTPEQESIDNFISRMENELLELSSYQPTFINSHTGKDYFSFDDNCRIIEASLNMAAKTGVRILHETHRGRFSFHAATLISYLEKFPELELVADFSHFCTVSESMLQDQEEIISKIIPHVSHIHARVGFEQGPQVNDPFAPEWENHLLIFEHWWQQIIQHKSEEGFQNITITPEFGPPPYMPVMPYTQKPLSNQWQVNVDMMNYIKSKIS